MNDGIVVIIALAVLAGGGTILVDLLVVRQIRRIHAQQTSRTAPTRTRSIRAAAGRE